MHLHSVYEPHPSLIQTSSSHKMFGEVTLLYMFLLHVISYLHHISSIIRESVDSLCRGGADVQYIILYILYAILKQKPYNFTTNMLKAYLSAQASSLSGFVISKTHVSGQKPPRRELNTEACCSESAIFRILLSFFVQPSIFQQRYLTNSLSTHCHFSTKLILITAWSPMTTQCLRSFKFNKSHSQHSVVAVHYKGCHFLNLNIHVHM